MTDRTRDQKWARQAASVFEGLPLEAILVGIREGMYVLDLPVAVRAAKLYQNDIDQAESVKRQAAIKKQVEAALAAFTAEADGEKRSKLMTRYLRLSDKESAEWKLQDDIWARREKLWKREVVS